MKKISNIFFTVLLMVSSITSVRAEESTELDVYAQNMYMLIANSEQLQNKVVVANGYLHLLDNAMVIYSSYNDYIYDTRENAVLIEMRDKDEFEKAKANIKDYLGETPLEGNPYAYLYGVVKQKNTMDDYAAHISYIDETKWQTDIIYQSAEENLLVNKQYDENELWKQAEKVSIYRLLADPLRYDGKKVKVEGVFEGMGSTAFLPNKDTENGLYWITSNVNTCSSLQGIEMEKQSNILKRYSVLGADRYEKINNVIMDKRLRVKAEMMFYAYSDDTFFQVGKYKGYDVLFYNYCITDLEVVDKDEPLLKIELEKNK